MVIDAQNQLLARYADRVVELEAALQEALDALREATAPISPPLLLVPDDSMLGVLQHGAEGGWPARIPPLRQK